MKRIHPGDSAGIEQICRLEQASFGEGGLNRWHLMPLVRHGRVYGYYENNTLIGCMQFLLDWENREKAYLYGFSMADGYRGRGLGTKFLKSSLAELAREGIKKVELTVAPDNQAARKVYEEKLGFQIIKHRIDEYGPGETRLVLELDLALPSSFS
ncbi:MAG: GNAT family N-acetyltransferase [Bacillota bacterium]